MSGPALRRVASHSAIHEAAWHDANDAWQLAQKAWTLSNEEAFSQVVEVFLQVVETRILAHAHEEETGLYHEWLAIDTNRQSVIDVLVLEHERLRRLAAAIENAMIQEHYDDAIWRMSRLLQIAAAHARHEEDVLRRLHDEEEVTE